MANTTKVQRAAQWWIEEVLAKSGPAKALGIELVSVEPERVEIRIPFNRDLVTLGDTTHGGVIATLVDVAGSAGSASGVEGDDATGGATSHLSVTYLQAAEGSDLTAVANVTHRTYTRTLSDVDVRDAAGGLVAKGAVISRIFRRGGSSSTSLSA
ncbi:uncharacterized protein (TIGR00369 family) [Murinocardiopsis flavida]|uniref:Uncharacterized protein (TIGR00369 family) n=1 Tax=Murinocardiopsis flavida TaxID=645275 RepID=A0A2P8DUJ6_9ACTN|nr:PaaI family thioesterase [Murinocardiopsis flavida]PSL00854.1 uncharacterized protein (TIGR00369 family) [Murinocardiopsis flavida]